MKDYKHYVRVNEAGIIVHGFSDAFEQPQQGDLQLSGEQDRHFQLALTNDKGQFRYKLIDGRMTERTQIELDAEWNNRPVHPTEADRIQALEDALAALMFGGV